MMHDTPRGAQPLPFPMDEAKELLAGIVLQVPQGMSRRDGSTSFEYVDREHAELAAVKLTVLLDHAVHEIEQLRDELAKVYEQNP